jgi:uncharacterized membrane protein YkoI
MMKKLIVTVVAIVAILGIAFAFTGYSNTNNSMSTSNNPTTSTSSGKVNETVKNTTANTKIAQSTYISPAEAQKIAKTYIEVSGATAGTPKLQNQDGTMVYVVPVIDSTNTSVGEINIDAITGKNLGGAGGAP